MGCVSFAFVAIQDRVVVEGHVQGPLVNHPCRHASRRDSNSSVRQRLSLQMWLQPVHILPSPFFLSHFFTHKEPAVSPTTFPCLCATVHTVPSSQCPSTPSPHDLGNLSSFLQTWLKYHPFSHSITLSTYPGHSLILSFSRNWCLCQDCARLPLLVPGCHLHVHQPPLLARRGVCSVHL